MSTRCTIRCAVYTRKSTEEGLEQEFNSLDAQREAGESYILSQKAEGWSLIPDQYDDGGFSGGTLERPALQQLLSDIEANMVDVVVVYKIDRLSRSLMDFAKLVEVFDRKSVTFVSVTQSFNTTTSMGRLTLNVLLSFAQFEREVTGERIRDKFAASKKKGMWMGGRPPLGYDVKDRKLVINVAEAKTVQRIFQRYLCLGCVRALRDELREKGVTSKRWTTCDGVQSGGTPFDRGALYNLLKNRLYTGQVPFKGAVYEGEHEAIVPTDLFEVVQAKMEELRRCPIGKPRALRPAVLTGTLFDEAGRPMTPSYSINPTGRRYRYYLSRTDGAYSEIEPPSRVPAVLVERIVQDAIQRFGLQGDGDLLTVHPALRRLDLKEKALELNFDAELAHQAAARNRALTSPRLLIARWQAALRDGEELTDRGGTIQVRTPLARNRRGRYAAHFPKGSEQPQPDTTLIAALARAHRWKQMLATGDAESIDVIATRTGSERTHVGRTLKLAFLSPDLIRNFLEGRQPPGLSLAQLLDADLPLIWRDQPAFVQALAQTF
jgi:site-specific DNA recombinase